MPELFEDVETEPRQTPAPVAETGKPGVWDRVKWSWETKSRGGKILIVVLICFGLFAAFGALGGGDSDAAAPESTTTTVAKTSTPVAPPTTAPAARLVASAKGRPSTDPLRQLPDLHPMVYAYAGADAASFSNVVMTLISAGASMCDLFFGVDAEGWRVVPRTVDVVYPNDYFPARVFISAPCPAPVGDPDPKNFIQPATPTTAAPK